MRAVRQPLRALSELGPLRALSELGPLRCALAQQALERERAGALLLQVQRDAELASSLFARSVGTVQPIRQTQRAALKGATFAARPLQRWRDEQLVLQQSLSNDFDVGTLLEVDEHMSFGRPGIGAEVTRRLRAGHWSIQRQLDLHGLRSDQAREQLAHFLRTALLHGLRCVRVVHGKGLGSPGKAAVLKHKVPRWLAQRQEVLAFVQARPVDGGAGAMLVLLQSGRAVGAAGGRSAPERSGAPAPG